MKCHECGGPCRKKDTKMVAMRVGRPGRRSRKARYKKHPVCDLCESTSLDSSLAFVANILREEIRKLKK